MKKFLPVLMAAAMFSGCASIPGTTQNALVDQLRAVALVAVQSYVSTGKFDSKAAETAAINALIVYLSNPSGAPPATPVTATVIAARNEAVASGLSLEEANKAAVAGLKKAVE